MEAYIIVLLIIIAVNVMLMLFFMDNYVKSIAAGSTDISFIVIGSLFMIFLFFIIAYIFARTSR